MFMAVHGWPSVHGWVSPSRSSILTIGLRKKSEGVKNSPTTLSESDSTKGFFDIFSPYESKIPLEIRDEIYAAEANTPAAKDRGQRVALYAIVAFMGILSAFFNGFLTELRTDGPDGNGVDLAEAGFAWLVSNPLLSFLFLNKIGGGISLLGGAGAGLLAEAELDTKRINAEKIYEELERRRAAKASKPKRVSTKKKRRPGKESKRMVALSEVMVSEESNLEKDESPAEVREGQNEEANSDGLVGSIKSIYEKADTMAASQALLLNKKLEDAGIVEKITDESGLKVIGKQRAKQVESETGTDNDDSK